MADNHDIELLRHAAFAANQILDEYFGKLGLCTNCAKMSLIAVMLREKSEAAGSVKDVEDLVEACLDALGAHRIEVEDFKSSDETMH